MPRYDPNEIEIRWQNKWDISNQNKTEEPGKGDKTYYALSMFPYPSGTLHMGHVRNYVITDVLARFHKMNGYKVLQPMGWDAFGLPAENAAIQRGVNPSEWTIQNINTMRAQLKRLGLAIDWEREVTTCKSNYYKWTQSLFLELFRSGLAYQKEATVNWDPIDKTVLANEQVDSEGRSWRSGAIVEKRKLKQWFLKITQYADELLRDLNQLNGWPEKVKTMQENWIGRSYGAEIEFTLEVKEKIKIKVFTTRPDTIFGATYIVLAPENQILDSLLTKQKLDELKSFRAEVQKSSDVQRSSDISSKRGMSLDLNVINPSNEAIIPIWMADYVLPEYGTGAVMGVPAHDERDFEFARTYGLEVKKVIQPKDSSMKYENQAYVENGVLTNSCEFNNMNSEEAKILIVKKGAAQNWASKKIKYKLRDWLISRQRFWGCPIPIIYCEKCGIQQVPNEDLPVELPDIASSSQVCEPLSNNTEWLSVKCPSCNEYATRESDTMDTFMCSSWYFMRFTDPKNETKAFDINSISKWLPVNQYVGGIEHAILHLLYARFFTKALSDQGLHKIKEPFDKLLTQGMVQGATYKNKSTGAYVSPSDIIDKKKPKDPRTNDDLELIFEKMSKSKFNGVDPGIVIEKYGADTARLFILFKAPPEKDLEWDDADVEGQYRFIQRLWKLIYKYRDYQGKDISFKQNNKDSDLERAINMAIKEITQDLNDEPQFNTAISEIMKFANAITNLFDVTNEKMLTKSIETLILLLSPFAPHIAEEFWLTLAKDGSIHNQLWPKYDEDALIKDSYDLVIQVKGKLRGTIEVPTNSSKDELTQLALESDVAKRWLDNNKPRRTIIVPGKLINFVP